MAGLIKSLFARGGDGAVSAGRDARSANAEAASGVRNIVVPHHAVDASVADPYVLVQAVVDFVNRMADEACFNPDELPRAAMQVYYVDYYVAQVGHGGLGQFLHNSGRSESTFSSIESGLDAMGLHDHSLVFAALRGWVESHPESNDPDAALDDLQASFFEAGGAEATRRASASWLVGLNELRSVDDDQYAQTMRAARDLNPRLRERLLGRRIGQIQSHLLSTVSTAQRMAALACEPREIVVQGGPGMTWDVEGGRVQMWMCRTNAGLRGAVIDERGIDLYAFHETGSMPGRPAPLGETWEEARARAWEDLPTSVDALEEEYRPFQPPTLGAKLSHVPLAEIEHARDFFQRHRVAAAIDLLMRRAYPELTVHSTSGNVVKAKDGDRVDGRAGVDTEIAEEQGVFWVFCGDETFEMWVREQGALLLSNDPDRSDPVARATRVQIDDHARRAETPWRLDVPR